LRDKVTGDVEYIETGTAVFAFRRGGSLVLINLGGKSEIYKKHSLMPYEFIVTEA
jgi:hypothetical protein